MGGETLPYRQELFGRDLRTCSEDLLAEQFDGFKVERAEAVARAAHLGQRDRFGRPFIGHVLRVAADVRPLLDDDGVVAALLHDAVEKGVATFEDLLAAGIDPATVEIVDILTQRGEQDDDEYLARCAAHPVAKIIKQADLVDKLDPAVLDGLDDAAADELRHQIAAKLAALDR